MCEATTCRVRDSSTSDKGQSLRPCLIDCQIGIAPNLDSLFLTIYFPIENERLDAARADADR